MGQIITFSSKGSFDNIERFLKSMDDQVEFDSLNDLGQRGVDALSNATPVDTGRAAASWFYTIKIDGSTCDIMWYNNDIDSAGTPVVILLQYGHGTGTGGYVQGQDFINPAIRSVFDDIQNKVWEVVTRS